MRERKLYAAAAAAAAAPPVHANSIAENGMQRPGKVFCAIIDCFG